MTIEELQEEARRVTEGQSQTAVAESLGCSRPAITKAFGDDAMRYKGLLSRIIEKHSDYRVEVVPTSFVLRSKDG